MSVRTYAFYTFGMNIYQSTNFNEAVRVLKKSQEISLLKKGGPKIEKKTSRKL